MAKLLAEEPDALMHARPDLWEPWRATAKATRPTKFGRLSRRATKSLNPVAPELSMKRGAPHSAKVPSVTGRI